jgi:beta-xylosidase
MISVCRAQNPIIQTNFTADPAPMVYNGTVYLYTSHDEDDATSFKMVDWKLYTSTDMANWTDHGTVASLATFPWAVQTNDAWAPQVIERGGKFYLYAPISVAGSPKNVIAVAVADSPLGPFKDVLGHPLISPASDNIDPTVFIDDGGQAYLYWGNPFRISDLIAFFVTYLDRICCWNTQPTKQLTQTLMFTVPAKA